MRSLLAIAAGIAAAASARFQLWATKCDELGMRRYDVSASVFNGRSGRVRAVRRAAVKRRNVLRNRAAHKRAMRRSGR